MIPDFYDNVPFDIEDFVATGSFARFSLSPAESGLVKDIPYVGFRKLYNFFITFFSLENIR